MLGSSKLVAFIWGRYIAQTIELLLIFLIVMFSYNFVLTDMMFYFKRLKRVNCAF